MAMIYTIGHSTRTLEELWRRLRGHGITHAGGYSVVSDVAAIAALQSRIAGAGIAEARHRYVWMKELGGRRKKTARRLAEHGTAQ